MKKLLIFLEIAFLYLCTFSLSAQNIDTLILRPGPSDGLDTEVRDNMDWPKWDDDDFIANAWTANDEYFIQRSLLKFDLSQIPTGKFIVSAKLSLFCNTISGHHQLHAGANSCYLLTVVEPWDQYSVHWSNQPTATMVDAITLPQSVSQTQDYPNINVTDQIDFFYNNLEQNYGFMLKLIEEYTYSAMVFASSNHIDHAKRPMLEVIYADCDIPDAEFSYSNTQVLGEVQFESEADPSVSYHWDFGTGAVSNLPNPSYVYPEMGTYYVCLTAINDCDTTYFCDSVSTCVTPIANFNYNFTSNLGEVQFNSLSEPYVSYLWSFGNGDTSNIASPLYTFPYQGIFNVCLTAISICDTTSYCLVINLCDQTNANFSYYQNEHLVSFTPTFQNNSTSYYWSFGDGFYSSLINPEHYYQNDGYYEICLEVSNFECYDFKCEIIPIIVSNSQITVIKDKVSIFPSPVSSQVNISILDPTLVVKGINMYNSEGVLINIMEAPNVIAQKFFSYNVSDYESGMYIIKIITENSIINKKIIVIRE